MTQRLLLHLVVAALLVAACGPKKPTSLLERLVAGDLDPDDLSSPLPLDPAVSAGRLDNGLSWWVQHNAEPPGQAVLRLVVKTGSVFEDEQQRGMAHFVEHMAFNGTANFPGTELVRYLESTGATFGAHLNAHTAFDETVYKLQVRTDPEELNTAFSVLRDWASGITFDPAEFEAERGVVLEEWRTSQGLSDRMQAALLPAQYGDSRYAERPPIGTEESLRSTGVEQAKRFWQDWYRPELMGVIAVGDFDVDAMGRLIEATFGDLANPADAPQWELPDIPHRQDPEVVLFDDPEMYVSLVQWSVLVGDAHEPTHGAYRKFLLQNLMLRAFAERLEFAAQLPDAPFVSASLGDTRLNAEKARHSLFAQALEGRSTEALDALLVEVERVKRHGFTEDELERARNAVLIWMQEYFEERDNTNSEEHAEEIVRVFTTGEPMPGEEYEHFLGGRYAHQFTVDDLNDFARSWLEGSGPTVVVLQPQKPDLALPEPDAVLAVLDAVAQRDIEPPAAAEGGLELLGSDPQPGSIAERRDDEALNVTRWTLSNGAAVLIKPTDFQADEVRFGAWSEGGIGRVDDADYLEANAATDLASRSGLGQLDLPGLLRWLDGRTINVWWQLSEHSESIGGYSAEDGIEAAMRMVHAVFTEPRFDEGAQRKYLDVVGSMLQNLDLDPGARFSQAVERAYWQNHPRHTLPTVEELAQLDGAVAQGVFADRFADASDWTFVFVGTASPDLLEPFVTKYLASLPDLDRDDASGDDGARPLDAAHREVVRAGSAPKSQVLLRWHGPWDGTEQQAVAFQALGGVLEVRLRERLREELGGTYGAGVAADLFRLEPARLELDIQFQCDPERVDELVAAAQAEVQAVRSEPPGATYLADYIARERRWIEEASRSNGFWLELLLDSVRRGGAVQTPASLNAELDGLTGEQVAAVAKAVLDDARRFEAVLLPGDGAEAPGE